MVQEILIYLSVIVCISAVLTIIARVIRQPPIIAYLIAGIVAGPLVLNLLENSGSMEIIQTFARIGVALLLFIVGLSLDLRIFKEIGKVSTVSGIFEMVLVTFAGFIISIWLGFSSISALYIGVAIAFSSTVVVVKILSDKKEMNTLHGRISLGILIVQDIAASIFLMIIPLINRGGNLESLAKLILIALALICAVFLISRFLFGRFLNYLAKSQEALFLFGIAWALVLAAVFFKLGFSLEIGALIAGISLASSKYVLDLEGKMKPLRDFFIMLFFVFFGSQLTGPITFVMLKNAVILSVLVMIVKPIIVMATLRFFGYTKRTNFLVSLSLSQISEFSLILILLGFSLGQISGDLMNLSVLVALITIGLSAYSIHASSFLSEKLLRFMNIFDGSVKEYKEKASRKKDYSIILFGYHRIGYKILEAIKKTGKNFLVVDYNPKVVASLIKKGIDCVYGDAGSKNFLYELGLGRCEMIVSTIPQEEINLAIAEVLNEISSKAVFIATAEQPRQALDLYNVRADYVVIPHHLGGDYASHLIKDLKTDKDRYLALGKKHKQELFNAKKSSTFY